ncbi:OLC1v1019288C1 [Oldenlandia corymbosa var. corymbosa]|uniref:OLC1v1019288C1 n=1 Tax=Oldenlandia corymbosa var. corymbosa TaxID=529605 RepID=A0AAV1EDZ4_OLDCO|nr:OLC1v1019288C1 [Oldenlandia corymbosa var. corymbosa]
MVTDSVGSINEASKQIGKQFAIALKCTLGRHCSLDFNLCGGVRCRPKVHVNEWINGSLKNMLVIFSKSISSAQHNQRFGYDRIHVELYVYAGMQELLGVMKFNAYISCEVKHFCKKAKVDDLHRPKKMVYYRRPQDPPGTEE